MEKEAAGFGEVYTNLAEVRIGVAVPLFLPDCLPLIL